MDGEVCSIEGVYTGKLEAILHKRINQFHAAVASSVSIFIFGKDRQLFQFDFL